MKRNNRASWWGWKRWVEKLAWNPTLKKTKILAFSPVTSWEMLIEGGKRKQCQISFSWAPKSLWMVTDTMKLKDVPWKENYDKPMQPIKKQRHHFVSKYPYSQIYGFSRSYVWMWELDHKEDWMPKNWCLQTVVLNWESLNFVRRSNQSVLKEIDLECSLEGLILKLKLWPSDVKSRPLGKDPDAGKDRRQEEKGKTENEMVGWHHWLNGHEFEQTPRDNRGQRSWYAVVHGVARSQAWLNDWIPTCSI